MQFVISTFALVDLICCGKIVNIICLTCIFSGKQPYFGSRGPVSIPPLLCFHRCPSSTSDCVSSRVCQWTCVHLWRNALCDLWTALQGHISRGYLQYPQRPRIVSENLSILPLAFPEEEGWGDVITPVYLFACLHE